MSRAMAATRPRSSFLESFRVEAFTVLVLAVLVPRIFFARPVILDNPNAATLIGQIDNVFVGAIFGAIVGLFLLRRVIAFPGSRVFSYIIPTYATSYGLVFVGLLL